MNQARALVSRLGLGKKWLRFRHVMYLGVLKNQKMNRFQRRYVSLIRNVSPVDGASGEVEAHILIHHKRIHEGIWALYSFAYFAGQPCRLVIHEDGSLTDDDKALIRRIFRGCLLVTRAEADARVEAYFQQHGLTRCAQLRQTLVFGLKLFDPAFFATNERIIIMDSDVLFFARPAALLDPPTPAPRYSLDVETCYCLKPAQLRELLGRDAVERFNPGVFGADTPRMDWNRIEAHLARPEFWTTEGKGDYFAELTLWAMELTLQNATPLPASYALAPPDAADPHLIFGHYCGGIRSAFSYYTNALPKLAHIFLPAAPAQKRDGGTELS